MKVEHVNKAKCVVISPNKFGKVQHESVMDIIRLKMDGNMSLLDINQEETTGDNTTIMFFLLSN